MDKVKEVEETDKTKGGFVRDLLKDFIVPIVVCVASITVATRANEIYRLQSLIAKNSELPTIKIAESRTFDDSGSLSDNTVEIYILDGKYNNYESEIIAFLDLNFEGMNNALGWTSFNKVDLPILNYYLILTYGDNVNLYGNIETWHGSETEYEDLLKKCETYYNKREELTLITSIHSYLKITYLNLLNEEETLYYLIGDYELSERPVQISNEQGEKQFEKWYKMVEDDLFLIMDDSYDIEVDDIFDMVNMVNSAGDLYKEWDNSSE